MDRLLFVELQKWRNASIRKPLLLRGARQVGKTHIVRQLGKLFKNYVEVNFEKYPELKKIFEYDLDPKRICRDVAITFKQKIVPGETLLFIDEVQEAPRAITALRYFYEDLPELHIIAAGSLIDFAIEKFGVPVGRINFLYMYPMSFIEYLVARGYKSLALEIINHEQTYAIGEVIHIQAIRLLGEYIAIGGMPEVVNQWLSTQDLLLCNKILKNIKNSYEQDFLKYAKKHEVKYVELLFQKIPSMICEHFKFSNISTKFKARELEPAMSLLEKAGIITQVLKSSGSGMPLGAEANFDKFKLIMHDIGLAQAILGDELKDWFLDPTQSLINKGNIAESFVGQELLAYSSPFDKHKLYYWHREERSSQAEIDYLLESRQEIVPIEVKSGHGGGLQSMHIFLETHPKSPYGIRFSINNYSYFDKICSLPLYAVAGVMADKSNILDFIN